MTTTDSHRTGATLGPLAARLETATGIDGDRPIGFTVDGVAYSGFAGDTIASALIAAGRLDCGPSTYLDRPRGILAAGVEEPNALVRVHAPDSAEVAESMLQATRVLIREGLTAEYLSGLGILDPGRDDATYEHRHTHTDVLVVGAGPAGLAAAREAAQSGARVLLLDDGVIPGGSLLSDPHAVIDGILAPEWIETTLAEAAAAEEFTYAPRTTVFGGYDSNYFVALEDRTGAEAGPRRRVWHIRAGQVVLATGAHERPIVFADNDRPGIMLASAVRTYLGRYGVLAGERVAIATTNDSAYALVADLVAPASTSPRSSTPARPPRRGRLKSPPIPGCGSSSAPPSPARPGRARGDGSPGSRSPPSMRTGWPPRRGRTSPSTSSPSPGVLSRHPPPRAPPRTHRVGRGHRRVRPCRTGPRPVHGRRDDRGVRTGHGPAAGSGSRE